MGKFQLSLDKALSRRAQVIILVLAGLVPTVYVLKQFGARPHFSKMIYFGQNRAATALPEVNTLNPPRLSKAGYDGQFYAQVAIHPLLTDPNLATALDMPSYRSRRILMPAMAHVLGFGNPEAVLGVYALLNLGFWFALLLGMVRFLKAETARDYLCILAAVFTTGSIVSLERALTDMPACTLLFYAAALGSAGATGAMVLAVLARETSAIYLVRFAWPLPETLKEWFVLAGRSALILTPMVLWVLYITHVFGKANDDTHPFVMPFTGWIKYAGVAWFNFTHMEWQTLWHQPLLSWSDALHHPGRAYSRCWGVIRVYLEDTTNQERLTFELLAPLSLLVQVCYFAIWPKLDSAYWRMGVIFSLMMICMNTSEEQIAYCRAVLPVTIAFNIELMRRRDGAFAFGFFAGNLGLVWGLRDMLAACFFK